MPEVVMELNDAVSDTDRQGKEQHSANQHLAAWSLSLARTLNIHVTPTDNTHRR